MPSPLILELANDFYLDYPSQSYPEILQKSNRPYVCLYIHTCYGFDVCVPYRTSINHKYSYHFKNSQRAKQHNSGLDYTKVVIITETRYLNSKIRTIDKDEYSETVKNLKRITKKVVQYIDDYMFHVCNIKLLSNEEFSRRYDRSTLKYFHAELGI